MSADTTTRDATRPRLFRPMAVAVLVLAILFGALYGYDRFRQGMMKEFLGGMKPPPAMVEAATAAAAPFPRSVPGIGSLSAQHQVTVAPEIGGRVVDILFEAGAHVHAGDPLLQLNDRPEQGDLALYRAQAKLAEANLARSRQLAAHQFAPRSTLDQDQSNLDVANANIARTQAVIAQKLIRAPFTGQLGIRQVERGQFVAAGGAIVTLTDLDTLYVDFTLPEQNRGLLAVGQEVEVRIAAFPERRFTAKLTTIEPQIGNDTRSIRLQATLGNPGHALLPGMFADVRVILPPVPDVVTVPETAINFSLYGDSVWVIAPDAADAKGQPRFKAIRTPVKTGDRQDGRVAILSGLKPGDRVAASGQIKIIPGEGVRIAETDTLTAPPSTPVY